MRRQLSGSLRALPEGRRRWNARNEKGARADGARRWQDMQSACVRFLDGWIAVAYTQHELHLFCRCLLSTYDSTVYRP